MMPPEIEIRQVQLFQGENVIPAELAIWDFDPEDANYVKLSLRYKDTEIARSSADYFSAMCDIRLVLEAQGLMLNCYGASRNVYPSPMSIDMGAGEKGFKLTLGQDARIKDLVSIFDTGSDVLPVSVVEQRAFFEAWAASLAKM